MTKPVSGHHMATVERGRETPALQGGALMWLGWDADRVLTGQRDFALTRPERRANVGLPQLWRSGSCMCSVASGSGMRSCRSRSISELSSMPSSSAMLVSHSQTRKMTMAPSVP